MMRKKIFLSAVLGGVFIFSGYTKLYPIEPFEYTFVDIGVINWQLAPFVARIFIGLEFLIGAFLIFNINLRKIAYKGGAVLLAIFSAYLIFLIVFKGNKGNCGCFGSFIEMTPLQALIKNIAMLGAFWLLYKYHDGWELNKKFSFLTAVIFAGAFALPFTLNPVSLDYSEAYLHKPETDFKLELDSLYNNAKLNVPPKSLSQGKHIISFLSLTCPHCKIAANKIRIMHERNPEISFYFVLNGEEKNLESFFEETNTHKIPHCLLGKDYFIPMAGLELPVIYFVNNSIVEYNVNYLDLDQYEIEKWLQK